MTVKNWLRKKSLHFLSRNFTSHILLYHSCFSEVPADLGDDIHNVRPANLYKQLTWYKKYYDIVSLQEWINTKNRRGLVAVTFDDAYKSVFDEGVNVLESLNIPATVFIIGSTLEGKIFWRDKIRYFESKGLAAEFIRFLNDKNLLEEEIRSGDFYKMSKNSAFAETLSNEELDREMDHFLEKKGLAEHLINYCVETKYDIIDHPLITYGNHTYHHYLLSTLSFEEQKKDLFRSHQLIKKIVNNRFINIFSVPFGGMNAFDSNTIKVCKELEVEALLLSSNSVNGITGLNNREGIAIADRYMVPDDLELMVDKIERMTYNRFKKYKFSTRN
ncbi:MAG: polysaccharide deacetylase family protein [Balneolaceae bacterium]|nr:polysaccharide deacetylase family protein [Balneolaceae bacterium]MDR9409804.1 polysaccharide deacetylase family protein [Balneolaceae bacterium]